MGSGVTSLFLIMLSAMITNNYVLVQFFGICPFLGVSKKLNSSIGMGITVTVVLIISSIITWPIYHLILYPNFTYTRTLVFIIVIASVVQMIDIIFKKLAPPLHAAFGIYLPLITTNCVVLGVVVINITNSYTLIESVFNAVGAGLGFTLALLLFSGVRARLDEVSEPTESFKGIPITLVAAAILSLAFSGITGLF